MDRLPARIDTPRLTVRHWTRHDAPKLADAIAASIDHLRPWMPWISEEPSPPDERVARIEKWHGEWENGGDSVYGVFSAGAVVGGTGLHRRVGPNGLEIGYWIHADHLRRGYATEVSRALTSAAFDVPGIERVEIHHDQANVASAGIPRRLGYTLIEISPRPAEAPAEVGVGWRWAVTKSEWAAADRPAAD